MSLSGDRLESLRAQIRAAVESGALEQALRFSEQAVALARAEGDRDSVGRAECHRAAILIALGRGAQAVRKLRQLLMSSACVVNRHLAAYNIAHFHDLESDPDRCFRYARLALDHAENAKRDDLVVRSHNMLAARLMASSYFDEASSHLHQALSRSPGNEASLDRALILSNLGYTQTIAGSQQAFSSLFESLRLLRRLGLGEQWEVFPRLNLSFAYLELERPNRALTHARIGIRQAERAATPQLIKNALYLLGEAAKLDGDEAAAFDAFDRLQREHYPDQIGLVDLLLATDTRKLVNLWV